MGGICGLERRNKMRDYLELGATPCDEQCAQVGSENYRHDAMKECRRYRELLEKQFPDFEATDCRFVIREEPHDFGTYYEIFVSYDPNNSDSVEFAYNVENNLPSNWE